MRSTSPATAVENDARPGSALRAFTEILRFELRFQALSPVWMAAAALFFALHFLAARKAGISIGVGPLADADHLPLNAAVGILEIALVFSVLLLFPGAALVATAITRDYELRTAELMFVRPIREPSYVLGRFCGGLVIAVIAALAGFAGLVAGHFAPGVDPERLRQATAAPYLYALAVGVLPNTFIIAALLSSGAALARSIAGAFAATVALFVLYGIAQALSLFPDTIHLAALLDPFGLAATVETTQYWTLAEIEGRLPGGTLLVNRALWLGIAAAAFAATLARYRFSLRRSSFRFRPRRERDVRTASAAWSLREGQTPKGSDPITRVTPTFGWRGTLAQLRSQLRMDLRVIFKSPPLYFVLGIAALGAYQYVHSETMEVWGYPKELLTTFLIDYFNVGLFELLLPTVAYYAGELVHRERQARLAEIVDATPMPSGITVLSKTTALCAAVLAVFGAAVITFIALQAQSGQMRFELGLYLQSVLVVNGVGNYVLAAVAVAILLLVRNRWLATFFIIAFVIGRMLLPAFGYENLLYQLRLPPIQHSDMNGFGAFGGQIAWLSAYWGAFIVLLLVAGHLIAPRGYYDSLKQRLADARSRFTPFTRVIASAAALAFVALGGWVFYNTHVLNEYVTLAEYSRLAAAYETKYRSYLGRPVPQPTSFDLAVDVFPAERRVEVRGTAELVNDGSTPIGEVLVLLNPNATVNAFELGTASLVETDANVRGAYVYRFNPPLPPGETLQMKWDLTRRNQGFRNFTDNVEVVENGTFLEGADLMPVLGYNTELELESANMRRRLGMGPRIPLPKLEDAATQREERYGRKLFANVRVVASTSADQTVISSGDLVQQWTEGDRRYFEYRTPQPVFPAIMLASARYAVARDSWNGIDLEVYHHPEHPYGVETLLDTAKAGLEYYSGAYGAYPLNVLRVFEYPRYRSYARPYVGGIAYPEMLGTVGRFPSGAMEFGVAHELAHYWWGGRIRTPHLQGQRLNEALASYSAFRLIENAKGVSAVHRELALAQHQYLSSRSRGLYAEELPVIRTEFAGIAYSKGALALYALHDIIGADKMNQALSRFVDKFGDQPPPFATSLDLVAELRAVAGEEHQALITDLFERITFYDVTVTSADVSPVGDEFEVTIGVNARQLEADATGAENEVPLDAWFDVTASPDGDVGDSVDALKPLYLRKHRLATGDQRIVFRVPSRPARVGVDPYRKMIDRNSTDNWRAL
jgi:ABC-type transport system involved in multi-copper enzyme maturation permease subunit